MQIERIFTQFVYLKYNDTHLHKFMILLLKAGLDIYVIKSSPEITLLRV